MAVAMQSRSPITPQHASGGTLIITRTQVLQLLSLDACISAVEDAFRAHGAGIAPAPAVLGLHAGSGGFHVKAALLQLDRLYFAAKTNANFPRNRTNHGLPTIQGMIALFDADRGYPLALMDSIEITRLRTAAASAVAAKYLARENARTLTLLGCGDQALAQLQALLRVRQLERVFLHDVNPEQSQRLSRHIKASESVEVEIVAMPEPAIRDSEICVTCTPARHHIIENNWVQPGTFIAAVGADSEDKCEIDPQLMAGSKVVADIRAQCAAIGDLHHAIAAGLMQASDIHAELGEIVAGRKPGRTSSREIIVFDSTGTALQDVAAAARVYSEARRRGAGITVNLNDSG